MQGDEGYLSVSFEPLRGRGTTKCNNREQQGTHHPRGLTTGLFGGFPFFYGREKGGEDYSGLGLGLGLGLCVFGVVFWCGVLVWFLGVHFKAPLPLFRNPGV